MQRSVNLAAPMETDSRKAESSWPPAATSSGPGAAGGWAGWLALVGSASAAAALALCFRSRYCGQVAANAVDDASSHRSEVLSLYRQIMRTARDWPSLNKKALILGIQDEFRANAGEADPQKLQKMLASAYSGLKELLHGANEAARLRATSHAPKGSWPPGRDDGMAQRPGVDRWALDELGVGPSPTLSEAKRAYRERAKACHPDSGVAADAEAFKRLQLAWEHVQQHLPAERSKRFQGQ